MQVTSNFNWLDSLKCKLNECTQNVYRKIAEYFINKLNLGQFQKIKHPSIQNYNKLIGILIHHAGETGENEGAVDVLKRIVEERNKKKELITNINEILEYKL
jgi:hypothetical protein